MRKIIRQGEKRKNNDKSRRQAFVRILSVCSPRVCPIQAVQARQRQNRHGRAQANIGHIQRLLRQVGAIKAPESCPYVYYPPRDAISILSGTITDVLLALLGLVG